MFAAFQRFSGRGRRAVELWLRRERAWRRRDRQLEDGDGEDHVRRVLGAPALFVLSPGRSGTELLSRVFEAAGGCDVHHAPLPELAYAACHAHRHGADGAALEAAVLAARWELLEAAALRDRLYVETNNRITVYAEGIARLLPAARFLVLVRHPAAFVRSAVRRGYYGPGDHLHLLPRGVPAAHFRARPPVARAAWLWAETYRLIRTFEDGAGAGRCRTLRAEDLFEDPDATASVLAWAGAPPLPRRRIERLLARPVNAQQGGDFPRYGQWSPEDRRRLRVEVEELASHYGYSLDAVSLDVTGAASGEDEG